MYRRTVLLIVLAASAVLGYRSSISAEDQVSELRWAGDPEGGAPYVEADPTHPERVVGFDVEIASLIAQGLRLTPRFVAISFASIDQSVERGDAQIGLSGVEDTPARRKTLTTTIPYYEFRNVMSVRSADSSRFRNLKDLAGRRVGTMGGTVAYQLLLEAQSITGLTAVSYDDDVHPYTDLLLGRIDAVVLDNVLAERRGRTLSGLTIQPDAISVGHYVGVLAVRDIQLRDVANDVLRGAMRDGTLERIFKKWKVWNDDQPGLYRRLLAGESISSGATQGAGQGVTLSRMEFTKRYFPSLLKASSVTIALSCLAMALAVLLGTVIATGRVYGNPPIRFALSLYVEVVRGTPLLLQLFVLYYGLASVVRLPAFVAALLGLGMNYAAYESEVYRSALTSVSVGQLEAARTLGLTEFQILRFIRAPQAFRLALAPMTNDFIALLKDSSLVSVLTVIELTKQTQIFATNMGSWLIPGALCAGLYLIMSLPLAAVARRLELRWRRPNS